MGHLAKDCSQNRRSELSSPGERWNGLEGDTNQWQRAANERDPLWMRMGHEVTWVISMHARKIMRVGPNIAFELNHSESLAVHAWAVQPTCTSLHLLALSPSLLIIIILYHTNLHSAITIDKRSSCLGKLSPAFPLCSGVSLVFMWPLVGVWFHFVH